MKRALAGAVIAAGLSVQAAFAAGPAEPVFGRWIIDQRSCGTPGDTAEDSPLVVRPLRVTWLASSCAVQTSYRVRDSWYLTAQCTPQRPAIPIVLALQRDTLAVTWDRAVFAPMRRCP